MDVFTVPAYVTRPGDLTSIYFQAQQLGTPTLLCLPHAMQIYPGDAWQPANSTPTKDTPGNSWLAVDAVQGSNDIHK